MCPGKVGNSGLGGVVDIDLPTPIQVAFKLSHHFTQEQANTIAEEVYKPLREIVKGLAAKGVR